MSDVGADEGLTTQRNASTVTRPAVMWSAAGLGAVFAASPFLLTLAVNDDFGPWEVIAATTLTNVGTTLALAAVLFLLERNFTRTVSTAVAERTRTEVAAQTQDIRAAAEDLQRKVSDIASELAERSQSRTSDTEAVIRSLRDTISFDTVATALERANDLNALRYGGVTVPAGPDLGSPRVQVFWGEIVGTGLGTGHVFDDAPPAIVLSYQVPYDQQTGGYAPARTLWRPAQSATDALEDLILQMRKAGHLTAAANVDPMLFICLSDALAETMARRGGAAAAWVSGRLDEWIVDGWAITDEGLESRDGIQIPASDFPDARFNAMPAAKMTPPVKFDPASPPGVDPRLWAFAVERARHKFAGSQSVALAASGRGPIAYNTATSPRARDDWLNSAGLS